jgi:SAM-dependent methyltransferase
MNISPSYWWARWKESRRVRSYWSLQSKPPLPLPRGWSEQSLKEMLSSLVVEGGVNHPDEAMRLYVEHDFRRFVYTFGLVPDAPGIELLELGADPYFTTTLLKKFGSANLTLANNYSWGREVREFTQKVVIRQTGEEIYYPFRMFNIEEEKSPYPDDSFDVVLYCEIFEHLTNDPVRSLIEIRRILKPGGLLLLTTPNAVRLENVCKLLDGVTPFDQYSGFGPYGRHNKEYTTGELRGVLSDNGFDIETHFTADVHQDYATTYKGLIKLKPLLESRVEDLGQYQFCLARVRPGAKHQQPVRPDWLYRSKHAAHYDS